MDQSIKPIERNPFDLYGPIPTEPHPSRLEDLRRVTEGLMPPTPQQCPPLPGSTGQRRLDVLADAYRTILIEVGCDLHSPHFHDTPLRAAKAILEMTRCEDPTLRVFPSDGVGNGGIVYQNGIWISSLCPHHILPWFGTACIAYLPTHSVLGLSKFSRLARYAATGLHTQEEVTATIARVLMENKELAAVGVGVSIRAYHTCMALRGVRDSGVDTTTQYLTGPFLTDEKTRAEFMGLVKHPPIMA